jgi:hypothetical protein
MSLPENIEPIGQVQESYGAYAKTVGSQIETTLKQNYPTVQVGYDSLGHKLVICNGPDTASRLSELIQAILAKDPLPTVDEKTVYEGCRTISLFPKNFSEPGAIYNV